MLNDLSMKEQDYPASLFDNKKMIYKKIYQFKIMYRIGGRHVFIIIWCS